MNPKTTRFSFLDKHGKRALFGRFGDISFSHCRLRPSINSVNPRAGGAPASTRRSSPGRCSSRSHTAPSRRTSAAKPSAVRRFGKSLEHGERPDEFLGIRRSQATPGQIPSKGERTRSTGGHIQVRGEQIQVDRAHIRSTVYHMRSQARHVENVGGRWGRRLGRCAHRQANSARRRAR